MAEQTGSTRRLFVCDNEHQKIIFKETLGGDKNCPLCKIIHPDGAGKEREAKGIFWDSL